MGTFHVFSLMGEGTSKSLDYICRARYEDAKFFYEMDTRKRFTEFRKQLKNILFHVSYKLNFY